MNHAAERFSLHGKLALITGASSGLGAHFAGLLAQAGARVAVAARRVDKLDITVNSIQAAGGEARAFALDVSDNNSVCACFDELAHWGVPDIVVNNAGVTVTRPALEQSVGDFEHVLCVVA